MVPEYESTYHRSLNCPNLLPVIQSYRLELRVAGPHELFYEHQPLPPVVRDYLWEQ